MPGPPGIQSPAAFPATIPPLPQTPIPPPEYDAAGAADSLVITVSLAMADSAGSPDKFSGPGIGSAAPAEAAGATESLSASLTLAMPIAGLAGASDALSVFVQPAPAPSPGTALPVASPAFIRSQMPRMHVQNLLTGQWLHRDVQGITQPSITWNLNNPDTFTATLSPPRADLMDSTGNPLFAEWRDAIYLEENDTIRFGGILTSSTVSGHAWNFTATGFGGYPTGMPYEGPNITQYNYEALDAVRYIWAWLQSQPYGNLGLQVDQTESGYLLGSAITNLASGVIARDAFARQSYIWLSDAASFTAGMRITINGYAYIIAIVMTDAAGTPTGQVRLASNLLEPHRTGEIVLQARSWTTLARDAAAGQPVLWLWDASGFSAGQQILVGSVPYTIGTIVTGSNGIATGQVSIVGLLHEAHSKGEQAVLAPTPFQLLWYNGTDCGQEIQSIQQEAVFDWYESHAWTDKAKNGVAHRLSFGVPRIGGRKPHLRFAEGENIIQPVQVTRDGTTFADRVFGQGAGSGGAMIRAEVSALSGQRLSRAQIYTDQTVLTGARMSAKAQKHLASVVNMDTPTQVVIKNHPNAPFGTFAPGDDIPVTMCTGWRNATVWSRITAMQQDPTTDLMTLTVKRSDSFSYETASGQAGTI